MKSSNEIDSDQPKNADELITNISKLMDEAEAMFSESSSQHAEETVELIRSHYGDDEHPVAARYTATKAKIAAVGRRADKVVRSYPYEAAAMALGVGLLMGACLRRRSA